MFTIVTHISYQVHSTLFPQHLRESEILEHPPYVYVNRVCIRPHHHKKTTHNCQHEVWIPHGFIEPTNGCVKHHTDIIRYFRYLEEGSQGGYQLLVV